MERVRRLVRVEVVAVVAEAVLEVLLHARDGDEREVVLRDVPVIGPGQEFHQGDLARGREETLRRRRAPRRRREDGGGARCRRSGREIPDSRSSEPVREPASDFAARVEVRREAVAADASADDRAGPRAGASPAIAAVDPEREAVAQVELGAERDVRDEPRVRFRRDARDERVKRHGAHPEPHVAAHPARAESVKAVELVGVHVDRRRRREGGARRRVDRVEAGAGPRQGHFETERAIDAEGSTQAERGRCADLDVGARVPEGPAPEVTAREGTDLPPAGVLPHGRTRLKGGRSREEGHRDAPRESGCVIPLSSLETHFASSRRPAFRSRDSRKNRTCRRPEREGS